MNLSGIAAGLFLGAIAAVFMAVALLTEDDDEQHVITSFSFEARIEVTQAEDGLLDDVLDQLRGWYEAPASWRYEFNSSDPARAHEFVVMVSDGERFWLYRGETNTYSVMPLSEFLGGTPPDAIGLPPPPSFGVLIGPLPLGDLDRFLTAMGRSAGTEAERSRGELILGQPTERIDLRSRDQSQTSTIWVDRDHPFVLRYEASLGPQQGRVTATVEQVSFGDDIEDAIFSFNPPPDAREEAPDDGISRGSGSSSFGSDLPPPEGFMAPAYVPDGYEARGFESSGAGQGTTSYGVTYELSGDDTRTLVIEQTMRAGGLADSQRAGEPIDIGDAEGYLQTSGDRTTLLWALDDLVLRITANGLELDELLRVAESMRP